MYAASQGTGHHKCVTRSTGGDNGRALYCQLRQPGGASEQLAIGAHAMTYPRRCPRCQTAYVPIGQGHLTIRSEPGGTPSHQFADQPGRVLTLHCLSCGGEYPWDFFADAVPSGAAALPPLRAGRSPARRQLPPL